MSFNPQFSRIGEILVHLGFANDEHVKDALVKQGNFGLKIGETMIKLGYVTERNLLEALHLQLEYDIIKEDDLLDLNVKTVALIPEPFAVENRVLAIKEENDCVIVAMTDPENIVVHDSLKKVLGKPIKTVLIGNGMLSDTLEKYYKTIRTSTQVDDAVSNR